MSGRATLHEEEQALAFQQGQEAALAFFYRQFHPALTLFAYHRIHNRQIAEEIASDAFIKTWKKHWKLDCYTSIRAYLYKIVQRDCQHAQKREHRRTEVQNLPTAKPECLDTPFHHLVRAETYRIVHTAIKTLSPGNRRVISMHFLEGKTTGQIARELNLHPHTVQTQKARGLKALHKIIQSPLLLPLYYLVLNFS